MMGRLVCACRTVIAVVSFLLAASGSSGDQWVYPRRLPAVGHPTGPVHQERADRPDEKDCIRRLPVMVAERRDGRLPRAAANGLLRFPAVSVEQPTRRWFQADRAIQRLPSISYQDAVPGPCVDEWSGPGLPLMPQAGQKPQAVSFPRCAAPEAAISGPSQPEISRLPAVHAGTPQFRQDPILRPPVEENTKRLPSIRLDSFHRPVSPGSHPQQSASAVRIELPDSTMLAMARHADELTLHGFALARRGAIYSARAEFISALGLIAQTLDAKDGGKSHSEALASGLRALREADDFRVRGSQLAAEMNIEGIVAAHRTPVLDDVPLDDLTPLIASQRYCSYARERLSIAIDNVPPGSKAAFGLGKAYLVLGDDTTRAQLADAPKAIAAYQAAIVADPHNHLAANELGVLLAQYGQFDEALRALHHSLSVRPTRETWHNLAVVQDRLGDAGMAGLARQRALAYSSRQPAAPSRVPVLWVTPEQFARSGPEQPHHVVPRSQSPAPTRPPKEKPRSASATWWQQASAETALGGSSVRLCQALVPDRPASGCVPCGHRGLNSACMPCDTNAFGPYGQGEYIGPSRSTHVAEYRLRVDDQLEFVYRLTREESATPYRLNVGDVIVVESMMDDNIKRQGTPDGQGLVIQPDGTITLPMLGQVRAARLTVEELRESLNEQYKKYVRDPQITVTPLTVNTKLEDLRAAVDSRYGQGGQSRRARVTPEGTIQLPAIGSVPAQGLTIGELKREIDERYSQIVDGVEVSPMLMERAPRYVYVIGEVRSSGRFALEGPTTVMQSIAMAGGWNVGANLRHIIVFRRTEDWCLIATKLNIQDALHGKTACPAGEIMLRDSDLVLVPKSSILLTDDLINLVFTRGIYGVLPVGFGWELARASTL